MKKKGFVLGKELGRMTMFLVCICVFAVSSIFAQDFDFQEKTVICDFDTCETVNNLGENYGVWEVNEQDKSQFCRSDYVVDYDVIQNEERRCFKLTYDVESSTAAYNGLWMQLGYLDMTPYEYLIFYVKADRELGCTERFMLEFKNVSGEVSKVLVQGIGSSWKRIRVPLLKLKGISDWTEMNEIVIVFDDRKVTKKVGALLIDDFELV